MSDPIATSTGTATAAPTAVTALNKSQAWARGQLLKAQKSETQRGFQKPHREDYKAPRRRSSEAQMAAQMAAHSWQSRGYLTRGDLWTMIQQKGKGFNVDKFLERQLSKGIGLGSGLVQSYLRGDYAKIAPSSPGQLGSPSNTASPNLAGMRGLTLQRGQIYMGATPQSGGTYTPILKSKTDFKPGAAKPGTPFQVPTTSLSEKDLKRAAANPGTTISVPGSSFAYNRV